MVWRLRPRVAVLWGLFMCVFIGLGGSCSPEQYKAEADAEVYKIIDSKWQEDFGSRANYTVSDARPSLNDIRIDDVMPQSGMLTLSQAVAIATAQNRDYQDQKEQLYLSGLNLTDVRHDFAQNWFATVDAGYSRNAADEGVEAGGDIGFDRLLSSGATVTTGIALDWARFLTGDPRTTLGSILYARISQPLLGAGRKAALENLTLAERRTLYQIRSFNWYRQDFVIRIVEQYYRVLQQADSLANAKSSYDSKQKLLERLEMEAKEGRTARFQVDQAEQSTLSAWDGYVRAEQNYKQLLDRFKIELSLPVSADISLDPNELQALVDLGISEPNYPPADAVETAFAKRLDLANSRDEVEDAERWVKVVANDLGIQLNLVADASVGSTEPTDYRRLQFHNGTYTLGLDGDLPIDRKDQRNSYREALINLQQRQRQYEEDAATVELEVRDAYRRLLEEAESYKTQKLGVELAEKRVAVNPLLWEAQRATTRDLLEAQDALQRAKNSLTSALVNHTMAKLTFFRDIGLLQVRPDGMWEQGAYRPAARADAQE